MVYLKTLTDGWATPTLSNFFSPAWETYREEDNFILKMSLPGIDKEEIQLKYRPDSQTFNIFVKDKVDKNIISQWKLDPESITASLDLGILRIRAPIKNSDVNIAIS